jgi:indole-3-glycerol phosphate synthase
MMKDILQEIIAHKHEELEALCAKKASLREALIQSDSGIIAEFKRRSPSKGWIKEEGRADIIPLSYQQNGAAALSILTDEHYFGGHDDFIRMARKSGVTLPILYKNFVVDEAQLYAAALCGASAVLLIAACLSKAECKRLLDKAHSLGLEVLLEMHSEPELEYAELEPDLCGINNRNLGSFVTDVENSFRLAELLPKDAVKVSESGISNPDTVKALRQAGFRGFLIGENFMKTANPGKALADFIGKLRIEN